MLKVSEGEDHEEASCSTVHGQHRVLKREGALGQSVFSSCQAALGKKENIYAAGRIPGTNLA